MTVLVDVAQLQAQVAALQAKLAEANKPRTLTLKVTAKKADGTGTDGAVSLYGMGRFPITLYAGQWERVLGAKAQIEAFLLDNKDKLATKD